MFGLHPEYKNFTFMNGDLKSFDEDSRLVFVLMPFGDEETRKHFNSLYRSIQETVEKACFHGGVLKCHRADQSEGLIVMEDVSTMMKKAALTVFDVSYPNLNVFFELGLACALDKKIILLYNHEAYYALHPNEQLPFDINQFRHVEYSDEKTLVSRLKAKIESAIKLDRFADVNIERVMEKVTKLTRHFGLETKAEIIKEEEQISDWEREQTMTVLDEYWNNNELENNHYQGVKYLDLELKVRVALGTDSWSHVKQILRYVYWSGQYQELIVNLSMLPSELSDCKRDWKVRNKKKNRAPD